MTRRDRLERNRNADLAAGEWAKEGLGVNCTFVDDDMKLIVGLAQRAVLAGLDGDFSPHMRIKFSEAAEKHRADHEKALGFKIWDSTKALPFASAE